MEKLREIHSMHTTFVKHVTNGCLA